MRLTTDDSTSTTAPDGTVYAWKGGDVVDVPDAFARVLLGIKDAGFEMATETASTIAARQATTTTRAKAPAKKAPPKRSAKVTEPDPEQSHSESGDADDDASA